MDRIENAIPRLPAAEAAFDKCIEKITSQLNLRDAEEWLRSAGNHIVTDLKEDYPGSLTQDTTSKPLWLREDQHDPKTHVVYTSRLPRTAYRYRNAMLEHLSAFLADCGFQSEVTLVDGECFKAEVTFPVLGADGSIIQEPPPPSDSMPPKSASAGTSLDARSSSNESKAGRRLKATPAYITDPLMDELSTSELINTTQINSIAVSKRRPCGSCSCCLSALTTTPTTATDLPTVRIPYGHDVSLSSGPDFSLVVSERHPSVFTSEEVFHSIVDISLKHDEPLHPLSAPHPRNKFHVQSVTPFRSELGEANSVRLTLAASPSTTGIRSYSVVAPPGYGVWPQRLPDGTVPSVVVSKLKTTDDSHGGRRGDTTHTKNLFRRYLSTASSVFCWMLLLSIFVAVCIPRAFILAHSKLGFDVANRTVGQLLPTNSFDIWYPSTYI